MNSNRTVVSDRLLEWPVALRVLNVAEAPAFAAERGAPADEAPLFSREPCRFCDSRCCSMRIVVSVVDALRIGRHVSMSILDFVQPMPHAPDLGTFYAWPFKLNTGRHVFLFRRDDGHCVHLDTADGQRRCGIYEQRAANCRLYPFVIDDGHGRLPGGTQNHCPTQWLQDDLLRTSIAEDARRYREDRAVELEIVRFWNRGRRDRTIEVFAEWLEGHVAPQLPLEP